MKTKIILNILFWGTVLGTSPTIASAERFAFKGSSAISLGNAISLSSPLELSTNLSSVKDFGIDFAYKAWECQKMNLELNLGIGYERITTKLGIADLSYNYLAGAYADEDGDNYIRFYELTDIRQNLNVEYFTIPIYASYNFRLGKWVTLHADAGIQIGFKLSDKLEYCSGDCRTWGVYPEYDDLLVDSPWINGFGHTTLGKDNTMDVETTVFTSSAIVGLGAEIKLAGHVYLDLGARYAVGFTNVYNGTIFQIKPTTAENALVTYTVAGGECVRPISSYANKSSLRQLALKAGIVIRF